jgi:CRP-like cAMP-binding protein
MAFDSGDLIHRSVRQWPTRARPASGADFAASQCFLLDADDDLAQAFDLRMRLAARQVLTATVLDVTPGEVDLVPSFGAVRSGLGLLILDGVLACDARVGDRTATELVGSGDLLQPPHHPPEELLVHVSSWRALQPARLAVLDEEFSERARPWPQIALVLLRRAGRRSDDLDVLRAIASQPRLEVRLVLVLWHLARRWGRVESSGIRLTLPLTHRLLGQIIGAERPSVTHALARLARAGLVTGSTDDLHLHGTLERQLSALAGRAAEQAMLEHGDAAG